MGLFVSRGCALRLVLLEPHSLIHHSLIQYHLVSEMVEEMVMGVGVRPSELDAELWSSDNPVGLEVDMRKPMLLPMVKCVSMKPLLCVAFNFLSILLFMNCLVI